MTANTYELKIASFEDGTHVVLRAGAAKPRHMEVIATFYNAAHAHDYVRLHGAPSEGHQVEKRRTVQEAAKRAPKQTSAPKAGPAARAKSKPLFAASPRRTSEVNLKQAAEVQVKPAPVAKAKQTAAPQVKSVSEATPQAGTAEMSERQAAVLMALRTLMNKQNRVEVKTAELAKASTVPLGSVHSILVSLEKKQLIRTERQGSPKFSAIYEVLESSQKRPMNAALKAA
jgi:uncharacterized membrane protein